MEANLSARKRKILAAVHDASKAGYDLTSDGVIAFLHGELSQDWAKDSSFYGCLVSLGSKQGKSAVRYLAQRGYLRQRYDASLDCYGLLLSEKGEAELPKAPKAKKKVAKKSTVYFLERK